MGIYTELYTEILARLSEIQRLALADLVGTKVDSKPYFPYKGQECFPYWTNRLSNATYTQEQYGIDMLHIVRTVNMRLTIGNVDDMYDGELQTTFNQFIGDFVEYIHLKSYSLLQTPTYPNPMRYLQQDIRLVSDTGLIAFSGGGAGKLQIGCEFVVELELTIKV